ncbi:MAG: hypothetical protein COA78_22620 [Blastopirellula sp.]|nr:MAG: hypothetical protein COA78_22620 [Blastopirellula sp.]
MISKISRNIMLRQFSLERCYKPKVLVSHPEWEYQDLLELAVASRSQIDELCFIQIGAFDGVSNDALNVLIKGHKNVKGIVIEPQIQAFEALKEHYQDYPNITPLRIVISNSDTEVDFYSSRLFSVQRASLNKQHVLKGAGVREENILQEKIKSCTFSTLIKEYQIDHLDLVQIDAEGYDAEILKMINFDEIKPSVIRFEHDHLSDRDSADCMSLLAKHGYRFLGEQRDIIAILSK